MKFSKPQVSNLILPESAPASTAARQHSKHKKSPGEKQKTPGPLFYCETAGKHSLAAEGRRKKPPSQ